VLGDGRAQVIVHDPRLHDRQALGHVDLDDVAHQLRGQDHAPVDGVDSSGHAGAGATGHDRRTMTGADRDRRGDVRGGARSDHRVRPSVLGPHGLVAQVRCDEAGVEQDPVARQRGEQVGDDGVGGLLATV
jgi:hypothetical protein